MSPATSILIVDDDSLVRAFAKEVLSAEGLRCEEAEDGSAAMARLASESYDAVLIDLIMPNQEGIETIQQITAASPDTFVVAMSGGAPRIPADAMLAIASLVGAHAVLHKPFTPEHLTKTMRDVLDLPTARRAEGAPA